MALTPEQRLVVERVARLTRERIAPRAADYDLAAQNPVESWRDLWREGYLAAVIPRAYGGLGLVRARRRGRLGQGGPPGARSRRYARPRLRRALGHARDARDLQPVGDVHEGADPRGRDARPAGCRHPGGRRGELRARLRGDLRRRR